MSIKNEIEKKQILSDLRKKQSDIEEVKARINEIKVEVISYQENKSVCLYKNQKLKVETENRRRELEERKVQYNSISSENNSPEYLIKIKEKEITRIINSILEKNIPFTSIE